MAGDYAVLFADELLSGVTASCGRSLTSCLRMSIDGLCGTDHIQARGEHDQREARYPLR